MTRQGKLVCLTMVTALAAGATSAATVTDRTYKSNGCAESAVAVDAYTKALELNFNDRDFDFAEDVGKFFDDDYFEVVDGVRGGVSSIKSYLGAIADQVESQDGSVVAPITREEDNCEVMAGGAVVRSSYYPIRIIDRDGSTSSKIKLLVTLASTCVDGKWLFQSSHRETIP
ncbi:hypothetical protein [Streptomyces chartreusis]|uniref:hypothetical protein n=1 Tax=Streptomyces chartreusis TaxID=1969 RepID=UPI00382671AA